MLFHGGVMFFSKKMSPDDFKKIRTNAGLSRADVAERLGVSFPTVAKWETGDKSVSLSIDQFEKFIRMASKPEEQRIIDEAMNQVTSLWQSKVAE